MSQSQNISTRNSLARLTMGLSMLAYGTAKLSRNPQCNKGRLLVALGAMKAAEGTVKYCPMKAMMQQSGMTGHTGVPEVGQLMKDFASKGMDMASGGSMAGGTGMAGGTMANAAMGVAGMAANAMSGNTSTGTGMGSGSNAGNNGNSTANKSNGSSPNNSGMGNGTGVVGTKAGWSSS